LQAGPAKRQLRHIGSIYHLLAKQGAFTNVAFIDDFRAAKKGRRSTKANDKFPVGLAHRDDMPIFLSRHFNSTQAGA
jgi:hypothetical protein